MVGDKLALAVRGQLLGTVTAGMQEVMLRLIGEHELAVIETCRTLATGRHKSVRGSSGQSDGALMVKTLGREEEETDRFRRRSEERKLSRLVPL